ncbi:MAG: hypothetical protein GC201_14570 [Alphaproteobacteria bacterium]|nr:hypothetical protein [Alphaproteobacteria bacterium]
MRPNASGPRRLEVIDGLRGYFLVFMVLNHLSFQHGYKLVKLNHGELGFVQDAPGFVFLSGLLIGMVYTRRMANGGFGGAATVIWRRAFQLFCYSTACIVTVLLLARLFPAAERAWSDWLGLLVGGDNGTALAAVALLYQPGYMDILPQYIVYLVAAPPLLMLCIRGRWYWVAALSAALWLAVQVGLHFPLAAGIDSVLGALHNGLVLRTHFNMLAWQVVFMSALILGTLTIQGRIDWREVFHPERRAAFVMASTITLFFAVVRLSWTWELLPESTVEHLIRYLDRTEFGAIYLLNFVSLAYVVGWLIVAGPRAEGAAARWSGRGLNALFRLPFLQLLGRNSLQVYAYHVILVYLLALFDRQLGPLPELLKDLFAVAAVASLALPALYMERRKSRSRTAVLPPVGPQAVAAAGAP